MGCNNRQSATKLEKQIILLIVWTAGNLIICLEGSTTKNEKNPISSARDSENSDEDIVWTYVKM